MIHFLVWKFCGDARVFEFPQLSLNFAFTQISDTRKLGEILVFYAALICQIKKKKKVDMQTYIKIIPSQHLLVQSYFLVDQNCSIWTIKIPERCQGPPFGDFIVNFERILHTVLVFPLLTFSKYIPASY